LGPVMVNAVCLNFHKKQNDFLKAFLTLLRNATSLNQPAKIVNISSLNGSIEEGSGTPFISAEGSFKNIVYGMSKVRHGAPKCRKVRQGSKFKKFRQSTQLVESSKRVP
jgi:hypothetical protein